MLKVLLKKQLMEVFKGYFYDAKKNQPRSKAAVIGWFIFFAVIIVGLLGGMFTYLSLSICGALTAAGMNWLYFALMSGIAIVLGAFGSVFNTYAGLYLSKDNDLLLSMPIPVKYIVSSRLLNVYLMGTLYSAVVILPAVIVYWIIAGATAANVVCGILLVILISLIVLMLSCLLGWCVAKVSQKLKRKSFAVVFVSLLFIAAYYFFYFKAQSLIQNLLLNAVEYGERIKGAAYGVYLFGRVGTGDVFAAVICAVVCAVLLAAVWFILKKTFLSIATTSGNSEKVRYKAKAAKEKSVFSAMLSKELAKFTSSPSYMLNCGLGILFILIGGVALLVKGPALMEALNDVFKARAGAVAILIATALCLLTSMNDMAAPSVSLEGKSLWIYQSLPVEPKTVLRSKLALQLILTEIPMLFTAICGACILDASVGTKLLVCLVALLFAAFMGVFGSFLGILMPNLTWTNEIVPIKQGGAVAICLFGGWVIGAIFVALYFLVGYQVGAELYLAAWAVILTAASLILLRWLDTGGAKRFSEL